MVVDAATVDAAISDAAVDANIIDATPPDAAPPSEEERLLYMANSATTPIQLFVASSDGVECTSYRVNGPLSTGMRVRDFAASSDGSLVSFTAKTSELFGSEELFVVDISTVDIAGTEPGPSQRLHDVLPLVDGVPVSGVHHFEWIPGKRAIVFRGGLGPSNDANVYLVEQDSAGTWSPPVQLNTTLPAETGVLDFAIAPDGQGLVYRAAQDTIAFRELYWVDLSGSAPAAPLKVSGAFAGTQGSVIERSATETGYAWSPDSSKLFYLADQATQNRHELFVVSVAGSEPQTPIRVNGALEIGSSVDRARWAPNSESIAYVARQTGDIGAGLYLARSLAPLSVAVNVSGDLYPEGSLVEQEPIWAPDGSGLVFHVGRFNSGGRFEELFYVSSTSDIPVRLNGPLTDGGAVTSGSHGTPNVNWSEDARFLVYTSTEDLSSTQELFLVRFDGGAPLPSVPISVPLPFPQSRVTQ